MTFPIQILFQERSIFAGVVDGAVELGRQQHHEAKADLLKFGPANTNANQPQRLIIAPLAETRIGRHQLLIEQADAGRSVRLKNLSDKVPVEIVGSGALEPGAVRTVLLPAEVVLASKHRVLVGDRELPKTLRSLGQATIAPGRHLDCIKHSSLQDLSLEGSGAEPFIQAMQAAMDVFQCARTEGELFESAIRGAVQLAGFDRAVVVTYEGQKWDPKWGRRAGGEHQSWPISQTVLNQVLAEKQTFWDAGAVETANTMTNIEGVIAAPILNRHGEIIGALYGDCRRNPIREGPEVISRLQARLMELLACGVASGLSRIEQEIRATTFKLQFEQYFTKKLAEELEENPNLIDGRDADVTVLFCDIRRFSRISEKIGTAQTFKWINDVMEVLSSCVNHYDGVVVDYIGDELMAMWGAPKPQHDHARLAALAAIEMVSRLPEVNSRWCDLIQEPLEIGIGLNSGPVRAGNTGSHFKFKYSPLGTTVNLASRVEGATKYLRTSVMMTGETARQLDKTIPARRLCSVRVVNIEEVVPLYELAPPDCTPAMVRNYERALTAFEQQDFRAAARILTQLLQKSPDDGPSLVLLSRTVNALVSGPLPDHPVWRLEGK